MPHDLRSFLEEADQAGELKQFTGAHWAKEMAAISEIVEQEGGRQSPALLFDEIPEYPAGYRTLYNQLGSPTRLAISVGLSQDYEGLLNLVERYNSLISSSTGREPITVSDGPVFENVRTGSDIDILDIPVPLHHERDGGRYIGTADCIITRDPDTSHVNVGTYRAQVKDHDEIFLYISPGKHGRYHMESYFEREEPMPVVMVFGQDPLLWTAACNELSEELNELEFAGGVRGEGYEIIKGPVTGLPIPAHAEIAVEGYIDPDARATEGPFGEWMGYYGSGAREEPYATIQAMYFRDDPILTCCPPHKPPQEPAVFNGVIRTGYLKQQLQAAGVPNVEGVWCHEIGGNRQFNVISIDQRYAGHARQAAHVGTNTRPGGAYIGRWTIVVDDDIDPTDTDDVLWAMTTRCDPVEDIEIMDRAWSTPLDPLVEEGAPPFNSRAIVDATIPYERLDDFPPVAETSSEYRAEILEKWGDELRNDGLIENS